METSIDPKVLLANPLLREYGQLVNLRLARVVSVFEPASYVAKVSRKRQCACVNSAPFVISKNDNVLKIFKNEVAYSTKMGKSLYYSVTDALETVCEYCYTKYLTIDTRYEACQKIEVLALCAEK